MCVYKYNHVYIMKLMITIVLVRMIVMMLIVLIEVIVVLYVNNVLTTK